MNELPKIILFDDDDANIKLYKHQFEEYFNLKGCQNPGDYETALQDDVVAILIDFFMPVMNGIELYSKLHSHRLYNGCPIIFMSASGSEEVMLNAMSTGGQDFLTRTMKKEEMVVRITNKIEFFKKNRQIFRLGSVMINTAELKAYYQNEAIELTLTEMKIMKFLLNNKGISTREEINQDVWPGQKVIPATLNTHLSNLRNKFPSWEYEIQFIKSKGVELILK